MCFVKKAGFGYPIRMEMAPDDKPYYAMAARELNGSQPRDEGLWLLSLDLAGGDEDKARLLYARHRVTELRFEANSHPRVRHRATAGMIHTPLIWPGERTGFVFSRDWLRRLPAALPLIMLSLACMWALARAQHMPTGSGKLALAQLGNAFSDLGWQSVTLLMRAALDFGGLGVWLFPLVGLLASVSVLKDDDWWAWLPKGKMLLFLGLVPFTLTVVVTTLGQPDMMGAMGGALGQGLYCFGRSVFDPVLGSGLCQALMMVCGVATQALLLRPLLYEPY